MYIKYFVYVITKEGRPRWYNVKASSEREAKNRLKNRVAKVLCVKRTQESNVLSSVDVRRHPQSSCIHV